MSTESGPLIYVVDDERVIATTVALILKQKGFDARAFFDPTELLMACLDVIPNVVLSDVVMPQMTGVELAIAIESKYPTCKLLLFSGQSATSMHLEDAAKRGYRFEVLAKPLHPLELLKRMGALTGHAL